MLLLVLLVLMVLLVLLVVMAGGELVVVKCCEASLEG